MTCMYHDGHVCIGQLVGLAIVPLLWFCFPLHIIKYLYSSFHFPPFIKSSHVEIFGYKSGFGETTSSRRFWPHNMEESSGRIMIWCIVRGDRNIHEGISWVEGPLRTVVLSWLFLSFFGFLVEWGEKLWSTMSCLHWYCSFL